MEAFVLTLRLDERSFAFFQELRRRHFPPGRNRVPAHLTLFHALPGEKMAAIRPLLAEAARGRQRMKMKVTGIKSLASGTAFVLQAPALVAFRKALQHEMEPFLTQQDRAGFSPHVTVQNKVPVSEAQALRRELQKGFRPFAAMGEGLLLWRYLDGPWLREAQFPFRG